MRRLAALVVVCLAGCGGGSSTRTAPIVEHGDGIRWVLPSGWHAATRSLTPHLANPREVLTAGTGRLASSPQRCAQFPSGALAAMRPTDVLVTVQERYGSTASFPGRPKHFTLGPAPGVEADACAGPHPAFVGHWWEFGEGGRGFHVLVAVGRSASRARVDQALSLLDSLRIAARMPVAIDPDTALPAHDGAAGLDFVHPAQWRWYRQPLTQLGEPAQALALGTFRLRQRAPDPNCTPSTALHQRPARGGFLFVYESSLRAARLRRIPPLGRDLRLIGPRPFECFGMSWRADFRAGGRAFTAHVYGPPARRREALAILESLRARAVPFSAAQHAARFRPASGWHTRVSGPSSRGCLTRASSWAATVPIADAPAALPPHGTIAELGPDDAVIAVVQWHECRALQGMRALRPPLTLAGAQRMQFPGPRGDELPLYRITGRFAGRYYVDVWVVPGRSRPTAAQRAAVNDELRGISWPAAL